jgi:hypothetical protein
MPHLGPAFLPISERYCLTMDGCGGPSASSVDNFVTSQGSWFGPLGNALPERLMQPLAPEVRRIQACGKLE